MEPNLAQLSLDPLPHQQHISNVLAQEGAQVVAGTVLGNVIFGSNDYQKKAADGAASACRNVLFLVDPYVQREHIINTKGRRVAGTCTWILQNKTFRSWMNGLNNFIWISGGPGKGKTMMSLYLTEELESFVKTRENTELMFCFCSHQDEKCNTAITVLQGLIQQIISKRPELLKHALPHFDTPEKLQQGLTSLETLWIVFRNMVGDTDLGTMFCVVDGLDECDEGSLALLVPKLVDLLSDRHFQKNHTGFKLAIISRDLHGLKGTTRIRLDPDNNQKVSNDIDQFITTRLEELSSIEGFNESIRAKIHDALSEGAAGTFLWVGFTMHELLQKRTCTELLETLKQMPKGLPAMYERMLLQIPAEKRHTSSLILRWVTLAFQPLCLKAIAAAVHLKTSDLHISLEQTTLDAIALCGPLLVIEHGRVSLVHQSARDYLLRIHDDRNPALDFFRMRLDNAHLELAQTCLNTIEQSTFKEKRLLNNDGVFIGEPLLKYAVIYWPEHAKHCSGLGAKIFNSHDLFFRKTSQLRDNWWFTYQKIKYSQFRQRRLNLSLIVCYLGIVPLVEAMLTKGWKLKVSRYFDKSSMLRGMALLWAVRGVNETVVRKLIDAGAGLNVRDGRGRTPLINACLWNDTSIAEALIRGGANVRVKDKRGLTALYISTSAGNEHITRLLMEKGAKMSEKPGITSTLLHEAAQKGNMHMLQMFLENGAGIGTRSSDGCTILQNAVAGGSEKVVQFLLDKGADIHGRGNLLKTALHSAVSLKQDTLVQLLVENGANIHDKDVNQVNALMVAVDEGSKEIAQLLLEKGADLHTKDNLGWNALMHAAGSGQEGIVQLLLERGADPNSKSDGGVTALHLAARRDSVTMIRLLVDSGADIHKVNWYGETAREVADSCENWAVSAYLKSLE